MYLLVKALLVLVLFGQSTAAQSPRPTYPVRAHYPLTIYANGYRGWVAISSHDNFFFLHGDTTLTIKPDTAGQYYLNTGTTKGDCSADETSYICLTFNQAGLLESVTPTLSATVGADKKSITLKTASITIDPGRFNREWYPSWGVEMDVRPGFYYGKKTLPLITGQTYAIDNAHVGLVDNCRCDNTTTPSQARYDQYYGSYFYFTILGNGQVKLNGSNLTSARACGRTVRIKTVLVSIDPAELSGGATVYIRQPYSKSMSITKKTKLPFIRGRVNYVYWPGIDGREINIPFLPL